jgi:signal transduction histidine kinase
MRLTPWSRQVASVPSDRGVNGRVDARGRLVTADPELEALQREAGSALGQMLALPQLAAVARLARELGTPVGRSALVASADQDIELWVEARPDGDDILLSLESWNARPAPGPRLGQLLGGSEASGSIARFEWSADEELKVIALSAELADLLGIESEAAAGIALTRLVRLDEDENGEMPLISALAARRNFTGQMAVSRNSDSVALVFSGQVVTDAGGGFAGFRGSAQAKGAEASAAKPAAAELSFDHAIDEILRSPLERIIGSAEEIVDRVDGPLRSDYASYGGDIAAAARHLSSVIREMGDDPAGGNLPIDLAALAAEAVVMVEPKAEERTVAIDLGESESLLARGQERAAIQILVNLIGNAVRYSPEGGTVRLQFSKTAGTASVAVRDDGPGIDAADQQRIFERFERADPSDNGTGLGLAISRRLARSMGGDISVDSKPGAGATFVLTLPLG